MSVVSTITLQPLHSVPYPPLPYPEPTLLILLLTTVVHRTDHGVHSSSMYYASLYFDLRRCPFRVRSRGQHQLTIRRPLPTLNRRRR